MRKKLLAMFLVSILAAYFLIGCGQTEQTSGETQMEESTQQTETTPEPTPEPTEEPHTHDYAEEITTQATCEAEGVKTFTCACGDTYEEAVPKVDHLYENYVFNNDSTYTADGTETSKCNTCELTDTRTAEGSKLEYTYTDTEAVKYAQQTVNVRDLPSTDGNKLGSLSTNDEVTVTATCNETGWYRITYNDGVAYVSNNYLGDSKVEVQAQASNGGESAAVSGVPRAGDYAVGTWNDMGTYSFCVTNDWHRPDYSNSYGFHINDGTVRWCWVVYSDKNDSALNTFIGANICGCGEPTHGGTFPYGGSN